MVPSRNSGVPGYPYEPHCLTARPLDVGLVGHQGSEVGFLDSVYERLREHAGPDGLVRIDVALIKKLVEMGIHGGVLNAALDSLVAKKLIVRVSTINTAS